MEGIIGKEIELRGVVQYVNNSIISTGTHLFFRQPHQLRPPHNPPRIELVLHPQRLLAYPVSPLETLLLQHLFVPLGPRLQPGFFLHLFGCLPRHRQPGLFFLDKAHFVFDSSATSCSCWFRVAWKVRALASAMAVLRRSMDSVEAHECQARVACGWDSG